MFLPYIFSTVTKKSLPFLSYSRIREKYAISNDSNLIFNNENKLPAGVFFTTPFLLRLLTSLFLQPSCNLNDRNIFQLQITLAKKLFAEPQKKSYVAREKKIEESQTKHFTLKLHKPLWAFGLN